MELLTFAALTSLGGKSACAQSALGKPVERMYVPLQQDDRGGQRDAGLKPEGRKHKRGVCKKQRSRIPLEASSEQRAATCNSPTAARIAQLAINKFNPNNP
jgi:hypothetical protein